MPIIWPSHDSINLDFDEERVQRSLSCLDEFATAHPVSPEVKGVFGRSVGHSLSEDLTPDKREVSFPAWVPAPTNWLSS